MKHAIRLTVNGRAREGAAEPRTSLADFLRDDLGLERDLPVAQARERVGLDRDLLLDARAPAAAESVASKTAIRWATYRGARIRRLRPPLLSDCAHQGQAVLSYGPVPTLAKGAPRLWTKLFVSAGSMECGRS